MGNYKSQFENYYSKINGNKGPQKRPRNTSIDYLANNGTRKSYARKSNGFWGKQLILQSIGALVLLLSLITLKNIQVEGAQDAYRVSKEMIQEKVVDTHSENTLNLNSFVTYKEVAIDYVESLKSMITGEKTLKEKIKDEYKIPIEGTAEKIGGDTQGILIYAKEKGKVITAFEGIVKEIKEEKDGVHITINHGNGIETYYGLLINVTVKTGDKIKTGQVIGESNNLLPENKEGIVFKLIYMGIERNPLDFMAFNEE